MTQYTGAQSLYNGISQAGQALGQGIQQYRQNKLMAAAGTAKFEAAAKQNPDLIQYLTSDQGKQVSPDVSAAFGRLQKGGSANIKDATLLSAFADMYSGQKQQQAQQAYLASEAAQNNAQARQINTRMGWLQNLMGGQGAPGQGGQPPPQPAPGGQPVPGGQATPNIPAYLQPNQQPAQAPSAATMQSLAPPPQQPTPGQGIPPTQGQPGVIIQPPKPLTVTDPQFQSMYPQILRNTLGDTDKATSIMQQQVDAANKQRQAQYDAQAKAVTPTGNLYFNGFEYKDGLPVNDLYVPENMVGKGTASQSVNAGTSTISIPHGGKPPGQVVFRGNENPDPTAQATMYNTNDPQWQSEVRDAYNQAGASAQALGSASLLQQAVDAYTTKNSSRMNALMALPGAQEIRQILTGSNPANGLAIAMASNTNSILNQIRGPNGSVGGRILMPEYENTAKLLGEAHMDNPSLRVAAQNLNAIADRRNSLDRAYAEYRKTMPSGNAQALAMKQFGAPPALRTPSGPPPIGAVALLKANPNPQMVQQFEAHYPGYYTSDFGVPRQ